MVIIYMLLFLLALFFLALPVVYFGQIDATTAALLVAGTAYAVWFFYRLLANRNKRT